MTSFSFTFYIRTEAGRIPVSEAILGEALLVDAGEKHTTLTLADYFSSLAQLVQSPPGRLPLPAFSDMSELPLLCKICSEKLGAFYHVARIEVSTEQQTTSFAVNTAVSPSGRKCLAEDHDLLTRRLPHAVHPFVPKVFLYTGPDDKYEHDPASPFVHLATEWLDDFHEWHLCSNGEAEKRFGLWSDNGVQFLRESEARQLFRRIARIISLSYNWPTGSFLQQWHHAAGDFIARRRDHEIDVRLVTARALGPFLFLPDHSEHVQFLSLALFLLDLSVRMRLDKLDGVGETVWLDDFVVQETVGGFIAAMKENSDQFGQAKETLFSLLASFSAEDLKNLGAPLLSSYEEMLSSSEFEQVQANFDRHVQNLAANLAPLSGGMPATHRPTNISAKD